MFRARKQLLTTLRVEEDANVAVGLSSSFVNRVKLEVGDLI